MKYVGHPYTYGGAPGTDGANGWDCSSFVNWVLGHDLQMTLPGSTRPGYTGTSHGPVVLQYATWSKATTIPASEVEAGDLCVWVGAGAGGHIGIAQSPTTMISALNPALGTIVTPIAGNGPPGVPLVHRRIGQGSTGCGAALPGIGLIYVAQIYLGSYHRRGIGRSRLLSLSNIPEENGRRLLGRRRRS
jgi:cell wall-associated NlpC family hydrolase